MTSAERSTRSLDSKRSSTDRWDSAGTASRSTSSLATPARPRRTASDLMLHDDLEPGEFRGRVERVDSAHVDLERALDGVVGVVGAERVVAGDPQEQVAVAGDDGRDPLVRVGGRRCWPSIEHPCCHGAAVLLHE